MSHEALPLVTIIIPTFNRYVLLRQCVTSLCALEYPRDRYEIIVVDDGSDDEAQGGRLRKELPGKDYQYVRLDKNRGVSAARNHGMLLARGELLAFLDDDCVVDKDWLGSVVTGFRAFPEAAAIGGSVLNPQDDPVAWASYILEFSMWFPVGGARPMRDIPACNIVYRRRDIVGMSFADIGKGAVYEDSIFNHQLRMRGKAIMFDPRIKVHHYQVEDRCEKQGFLKSQQRYGLGFTRGGYAVHGALGKLLFRAPLLNLGCLRLILVFWRCCRSALFLKKFFTSFGLIVSGEWERNKVIFLKSGCSGV